MTTFSSDYTVFRLLDLEDFSDLVGDSKPGIESFSHKLNAFFLVFLSLGLNVLTDANESGNSI